MKKLTLLLMPLLMLGAIFAGGTNVAYAQACDLAPGAGGDFLGFPTWYKYLNGETVNGRCTPKVDQPKGALKIGYAIIEILTRVAALVALGFLLAGGIRLITSQGSPENIAAARSTIANAIIGLIFALIATALVSFIAGRLG